MLHTGPAIRQYLRSHLVRRSRAALAHGVACGFQLVSVICSRSTSPTVTSISRSYPIKPVRERTAEIRDKGGTRWIPRRQSCPSEL